MLKNENAICVYPTDTVYGMGTPVNNAKAIDRIGMLLQKDKTRLFSFICSDFAQISTYARISTGAFRTMKHHLPGPFTFILPATSYVPKKVVPKRKTVGIRMPNSPACLQLVELMGEPLANTSIGIEGAMRGDPDAIMPAILNEVDVFLDAGPLDNPENSTIIDLTDDTPVLGRQGKGIFEG